MKDGADLSPPVLSDVNGDLQLLRDKRSFSDAEECMTIVLQFLEHMTVVSACLDNAVFAIWQHTHWIIVPLPLLGKFLLEVLLISDGVNI
jgi:hypothetical protein